MSTETARKPIAETTAGPNYKPGADTTGFDLERFLLRAALYIVAVLALIRWWTIPVVTDVQRLELLRHSSVVVFAVCVAGLACSVVRR